jgi:hypothetical protein
MKLMTPRRNGRVAAALLGLAAVVAACTTSVAGHPVAAAGHSPPSSWATKPKTAPVSARDLLLRDGDQTPLGPAAARPVGDTFFTSASPPECAAAMLFKDSPLPPAGSSDHAESAYTFGASAIYAESADVYVKALKPHDVVWNGFGAVAKCNDDAVGVAPVAQSGPMQLRKFSVPADGVLVWTMTGPVETCDYGLVAAPQATLLLVACDREATRISMPDWASKRREQIMARAA